MRKLITPLFAAIVFLATVWTFSVVGAASAQLHAANYAVRPAVTLGFDFEDGTVQGWEVNTNTLTTTLSVQNSTQYYYSGTRSLRVNVQDTQATTITLSAVDVPSVSTGNIITAYVQVRGTFVLTAYGALAAIDANGNYHFGIPAALPTNQWVPLTMVFTTSVPMPLQQLGVGVGMGRLPFGTFTAQYYIDAVQWDTIAFPTVTPTPPPLDTPTATSTTLPSTATATVAPPTATATGVLPTITLPPLTGTPVPTDTPLATGTPALTETALPSVTPTDCPIPFVDINGNVFYTAIKYLYCRGVVNGTDSTHYSPAGTSTRAQFAKVVVLGFGIASYTPVLPSFTDVPPTYFAYQYIEAGRNAGILSGYDAQTCAAIGAVYPCYGPNRPITRAQLTKLVVAAGGFSLYTPTSGQTFSDVGPSNVFYVSIETAAHYGIVGGYPDNTFRPNNNIRRDEMAQIVYKGVTTP